MLKFFVVCLYFLFTNILAEEKEESFIGLDKVINNLVNLDNTELVILSDFSQQTQVSNTKLGSTTRCTFSTIFFASEIHQICHWQIKLIFLGKTSTRFELS